MKNVNKPLKLIFAITIVTTMLVIAWLCLPAAPVAAQEPEPEYTDCEVVTSTVINLGSYIGYTGSREPNNPGNATGPSDGTVATFWDLNDSLYYTCVYYNLPAIITGSIVVDTDYVLHSTYREAIYGHPNVGAIDTDTISVPGEGWVQIDDWSYDGSISGYQIGSIAFCAYNGDALTMWKYNDVDAAEIIVTGEICYPTLYTCPTVDDYHFVSSDTLTDTWLLSGATITDSILTLAPGDIAAQNLADLSSETSYNAVISVTSTISDPVLNVILGTQSEQLTITGTGIFTANFTTPLLAGPLAYVFQSIETNTGNIEIDYTCLYRSDDNTQAECIAPLNGEFTTDDYWSWFNSARWWTPAQAAFLPHVDVGMTQAQTFTAPSLADGEYLLISFEARSETNNGIIGGKVWGGVATDTNISYFYYETYPSTYHYEADISTLAGDTNNQLIMGNVSETPPEGYDGTGIDNIILDNVCIFVSDDPPQLPYAIDENQPQFVNLGLNYTTCEDINGLWAWYGVNMAQYQATYLAGTSVWDPIGWVPWLISAIWVNLAAWSCLVMDIYAAALSTAEYLLNNFLNFVFWLLASWENFKDWLNGWGLWLALSITNILLALFPWLGDLVGWLYESGMNLAGWAWSSVAGFWGWLATYLFNLNGLRTLFNWLIDYGWNPLMDALGVVFSAILDVFINIWNNGLFPTLLAFFSPLGFFLLLPELTAMILEFAYAAWDVVYMLFMWLWENVISVGHVPLTFYYSFDTAMNSTAYAALVSCTGVNFWCTFLAGVQIVNQVISHSILYPIVIVGIVLSTIWVLWENIKELFSINIQ